MAKYRVIWFDDEFKELEVRVSERAHLNDITLVGFDNAKTGIEELKRNVKQYDAAIIDGLFFMQSGQSGTPSSDQPLNEVLHVINNLRSNKVLPTFVLSGQPTFTKQTNPVVYTWNKRVYDKNNLDDINALWEDVKEAANGQPETQLRNAYEPAFEVCTDEYIGAESAKSLLLLLESVQNISKEYNTEEKLNAVRKIVEKLFSTFNKIKVLPDAVWKGAGNINNSSKLLTGNHLAYSLQSEIMPTVISVFLKNILNLTQDGSHAEGELILKVDAFIKQQPTGYLFSSVVFQLMEVLVWAKTYFDTHKDFEKNECIATLKPDIPSSVVEGVIQQDSGGNYHCGDVIITYKHFGERGYSVGDSIRVVRCGTNGNERTKHLYPKTALKTEKI